MATSQCFPPMVAVQVPAISTARSRGMVYECSLSAIAVARAESELREDEETREHGLGAMRNWIDQHPHISGCRTDAVFLLRFLRSRKFSIPQAQELLERYLAMRETHTHWLRNLTVDDPMVNEVIDLGIFVPLSKRDSAGRQVWLTRISPLDPRKFTLTQLIRVSCLIIEVILEDEEIQVCGVVHVADMSGLTLSHVGLLTIPDLLVGMRCMQNCAPLRVNNYHFVQLPGFTKPVHDFIISLLHEKMRKRVMVHTDIAGLKEVIDPSILPKEYGGTVPMQDMLDDLKAKVAAKRETIESLERMHIKIVPGSKLSTETAMDNQAFGVAGSFRKLEID